MEKQYQLHLQRGRGFVQRELEEVDEQLEARKEWHDNFETEGKILPQRGDNTNTSAQILVIRCTTRNARKMHKLTSNLLSLPQAQPYLEGGDVRKPFY